MIEKLFLNMRAAMVASQLRTNAVTDPRIIDAFASVPRHDFVPANRAAVSYTDVPVPLGEGRWLNPPVATARILMEARIQPSDHVLLVGSATGYCAALIATLGASVVAVEESSHLCALIPPAVLADEKIVFVTGALAVGHSLNGPYDVIIIDGAIETLPQAIVDQCKNSGRLITAVIEGQLSRLSIGHKSGGAMSLKPFLDCQSIILPGFAKAREFVF
ncbi:MAG: protein-L-isoaspartate O-methyltransferase family protein [Sphingomonadaceae bacterium]